MKALSQNEQKERAARTAVDTLLEKGLLHSGMKIGLGTGSTALPAVKRLAEHLADGTLTGYGGGLDIKKKLLELEASTVVQKDRYL